MTMTTRETEEFLKRPLVTVLSTVDKEGRPRSAPIWIHWEDGAAYMFTGRDSLKWRNLQRYPHAALCMAPNDLPYKYVVMNGPVEEVDRPPFELVLNSALRYYGEEHGRNYAETYREDDGKTVVFKLTPERIVSYESTTYPAND